MITEKDEITEELISQVENVLEVWASKGKIIKLSEIETEIGQKIWWECWKYILDPIYRKSWDRDGVDLSLIVVTDRTGYPAYFSQGAEARSVHFNPNKHDTEWIKQLDLIFSIWKARRK